MNTVNTLGAGVEAHMNTVETSGRLEPVVFEAVDEVRVLEVHVAVAHA